jgi:hypothetical protein
VFGTEDVTRGRASRTWQGRPHLPGRPHQQGQSCLVVRPCLALVAHWLHFSPKCVPVHKICNTTRGTLLVSKVCMKLVVYSSRTRGFDGRIFIVRTVNTSAPLMGRAHQSNRVGSHAKPHARTPRPPRMLIQVGFDPFAPSAAPSRRPWSPCVLLDRILAVKDIDAPHRDTEPGEEEHHDDEDPGITIRRAAPRKRSPPWSHYTAPHQGECRRRCVFVFSTTYCRRPGQG